MKKFITTLLAVIVFGTFISYGQYNVLLNFTGTNGSEPSGGVTISGNNIYGTTSYGGFGSGCIYMLHRDGTGYKDLYNFVDSTGDLPNNTVTLYNGKLYGTTFEGGSFRYYGVVYSVDTDGSNYKILLNFNYTNGDEPPTDLLLSGSRIYGIASGGGFYGGGCIFTIDTDGTNYKDLYDFGAASGDAPYCKLLLVGTKFYGTTFGAGTYGGGTIFSIDTNGGNYAVMHNFGGGTEASNPYSTLTLIGNTLFGTTYYGGTSNKGALFSIDINGSGYKKIFDFNGTNGANPDMGSLKFEGNRLWGMASNGGAYNKGLVFSIDTNGSGYLDRFDFNNTIGANPDAQLTFYGSSLYGETSFGGLRNDGIVFGADTNCFMGSLLVTSNITCHAANNGSASISVTGGAPPYTYLWSNSGTQSSISNLTPGTYSITLSDNSGSCTQTLSFTITQPAVLSGVTAGAISNVSCRGGNDGEANANVSNGGGPFHYSWVNAAHSVVSTFNPTGAFLSAGTYTVTVTDNCSGSATAAVTITQPGVISVTASVVGSPSCNGSANGSATCTPSGGTQPYTYSWSGGSTFVVSTSQTASGLIAGSYTVTVYDACGTPATANVNIAQPKALRDSITPAVTQVGCNGGSGGTATAGVKGGTMPYTYSWSNGKTTAMISGLSAGYYYVTVSDHNGCSLTIPAFVTITQPAAIRDSLASITYPFCNGGKGTASVGVTGGTLPYSYIWTSGVSTTATANNITSRTYTVTIKDKYNCPSSPIIFTLTQPVAIHDTIVSSSKVNVSCNGGNNGRATVGVKYGAGPYGYTWTPNVSTTATATGLSAGVYSITVTDNNGCSSSIAKVTITQPGLLRDSVKSGYTCTNSLLTVTLGVKGGTIPYTYGWAPGGGTKQQMTGLAPGTYTITVTDENNCSNTITTALACPPAAPHEGEDNGPEPQCCAGIENINLYPNPNSGQFTLSGLQVGMRIEMYDYTGGKISSQLVITNYSLLINISDQPNGVYLIRILSKEGTLISQKKVVKTQ